jgi:hypothetical protein
VKPMNWSPPFCVPPSTLGNGSSRQQIGPNPHALNFPTESI